MKLIKEFFKQQTQQPIKLNLSTWNHPLTGDKIIMDICEECVSEQGLSYKFFDLDQFAAQLKADGWEMVSAGKVPKMREQPRRQFPKPFKKGQLFQLAPNQMTTFATTKHEDSYGLKISKEDKTYWDVEECQEARFEMLVDEDLMLNDYVDLPMMTPVGLHYAKYRSIKELLRPVNIKEKLSHWIVKLFRLNKKALFQEIIDVVTKHWHKKLN